MVEEPSNLNESKSEAGDSMLSVGSPKPVRLMMKGEAKDSLTGINLVKFVT